MADKMVLLALASAAGRETSEAFPSVAAICAFGPMNRKTVLAALSRLEAAGFIADTGKRTGRTGQVKVFALKLSNGPKNGTLKECQKRDHPENGTLSAISEKGLKINDLETVPKTERSQKRDTEPSSSKTTSSQKTVGIRKTSTANETEQPADVSDQVWTDFVAHRRTMKAPVSTTALAAIRREAENAGWLIEAALTECISRGWRGFKAKWVQDDGAARGEPTTTTGDPQNFLDHRIAKRREEEGWRQSRFETADQRQARERAEWLEANYGPNSPRAARLRGEGS